MKPKLNKIRRECHKYTREYLRNCRRGEEFNSFVIEGVFDMFKKVYGIKVGEYLEREFWRKNGIKLRIIAKQNLRF